MVGDKWTLLIVRDLAAGPRRFVELQRLLPGISTEQLRSRLNRMVADGMLTRKRYREVPPRVDYDLTDRARQLMPILGELARWGYDWAWSAPRSSEQVDIGAIFRLGSGLIGSSHGTGTVQCTVTSGPTYYFCFADGKLTVSESTPAQAPAATITGSTDAWVDAFLPEPDRDRGGLAIEGDKRLAGLLLDGLTLSAPRAARTASAA